MTIENDNVIVHFMYDEKGMFVENGIGTGDRERKFIAPDKGVCKIPNSEEFDEFILVINGEEKDRQCNIEIGDIIEIKLPD